MKVRFPNEGIFIDVPGFKIEDFKIDKEYPNEVFGWWQNIYVAIDSKEYNELKDSLES